jgi:hypothetical protein
LRLLAVGFALAAAPAPGTENNPTTRLSLKGLEGVRLDVTGPGPEATRDGLSAEAIRAAAEPRLRKAGIPLLSAEEHRRSLRRPSLRVRVVASKLPTREYLYTVDVTLVQWVALLNDPDVSVTGAIPVPAETWSSGGVLGIVPEEDLRKTVLEVAGPMVEAYAEAHRLANPAPR